MIDSTGVVPSAKVPAKDVMYVIKASSINSHAFVFPLGELNSAFHRTYAIRGVNNALAARGLAHTSVCIVSWSTASSA